MNKALLLIGGNIGDRSLELRMARERIASTAGRIDNISSIYETAPWGNPDQPYFYNQAILLSTSLGPDRLMKMLLEIEQSAGRTRTVKNGPRTIDIDILLFNNEQIKKAGLTIPHPELANRRFALAPAREIAPGWIHPGLKQSMEELWKACSDPLPVKKI
jgi:2-amino-4-hydroxy-6-hydroxymethyldihydropteridine diphosphokinase